MQTIKLIIEYDGTKYCGWQVQRSRKRSIQGVIQDALARILQERVLVKGSGRTDAGVHARGQVAHFVTASRMQPARIHKALNALLPDSIAVLEARGVREGFHSRFDARSKTYRYTVLNQEHRCALDRHQVFWYPYAVDVEQMRGAAELLIGRHDFRAFQRSGGRRDTVRTVYKIKIAKRKALIYIDIEANGFLYQMVRSMVGTLLSVGQKKITLRQVERIVTEGTRSLCGPTAPARGLCLMKVRY